MKRVGVEYTLVLLLVAVVMAGGGVVLFGSHLADGLWAGVAAGFVVQLVTFLALLLRAGPQRIMIAYGLGVLIRFGSIGLMAFLVIPALALPEAATLLSMVGFFFPTTLIEAAFMKRRQAVVQAAGVTTIQTEL